MTGVSLRINEKLASGAFGDVYKGFFQEKKCAVKVSKSEDENGSLLNEDMILRYLHRDKKALKAHVIKRYSVEQVVGDRIGLVLELLGPSLWDHVFYNKKDLSLQETRSITKQLAQACDFIHKADVIHADIKSANVLLSSNGRIVKLADFGLSFFKEAAHIPSYKIQTYSYRSPEVILDQNPTTSIDIWSLASLISEIYIKKTMFRSKEYMIAGEEDESALVAHHHVLLERRYPDELVEKASSEGRAVFNGSHLKIVDWVDTLSQSILKSSSLKKESEEEARQMIDLLKKMFTYRPEARITAAEILDDVFLSNLNPSSSREKRKRFSLEESVEKG